MYLTPLSQFQEGIFLKINFIIVVQILIVPLIPFAPYNNTALVPFMELIIAYIGHKNMIPSSFLLPLDTEDGKAAYLFDCTFLAYNLRHQ